MSGHEYFNEREHTCEYLSDPYPLRERPATGPSVCRSPRSGFFYFIVKSVTVNDIKWSFSKKFLYSGADDGKAMV